MKEQLRKDIGAKLLRVRKGLRFTQAEMAPHFDIGRANYSRIEKGEIFPNEVMLYTLRREFGISLDWLIAGEGPMKVPDFPAKDPTQCGRELEELEFMMTRIPMVKHAVLGHFLEYRHQNEDMIRQLLEEEDRKNGTQPVKARK